MKIIDKIFSVKNEEEICEDIVISKHKVINVFGLKFKKNILTKSIKQTNKSLFNVKQEFKSFLNSYYNNKEKDFLMNYNILRTLDFIFPRPEFVVDDKLYEPLRKNLNKNALERLNQVIQRNNRVSEYYKYIKCYPKAYEVYSESELSELEKIKEYDRQIRFKDNYYEWNNIKLPIRFFEPAVFYYKYGLDLIDKNSVGDGSIIDVGGYIGDSACLFRNEFPNNEIIVFEPDKELNKLIQKTKKLNNLQNIKIESIALGDSNENKHITNMGLGSVGSQITPNGNLIKMNTLDDYIDKHNIKIGLIKVDIEGYEQNFIQGATKTIQTQAPVMLMSIYHKIDDFLNIKPMIEKIMVKSNYEYDFDIFQGVYHGTILDCLLICKPKKKNG